MNNILYKLYQGELQPCRKYQDRVPGHLLRRKQCLQKHRAVMERPEAFLEGFRLGAGLMVEILAGE